MIPEDFPHFFLNSNPHFQKKRFLHNADQIICVSNYTMSRLSHHYPHLIHKAIVVSPGVTAPAKVNLEEVRDFNILYVGERGLYKDFNTLLKSLPLLLKSEPRLQVLAVGVDNFNDSESALITELGLVGRVIQRELSDRELGEAYRRCFAVVITSHVEGFGLPVIEAMAHGALVVATDIPVFNEVGQGTFLSFAPGDFAGLASVIRGVLANPEAFVSNRETGLLIANEYSWKKTFIKLSNVYREISDQSNKL
jgi:glycosyltransferase involved in cell wall biosynthesis